MISKTCTVHIEKHRTFVYVLKSPHSFVNVLALGTSGWVTLICFVARDVYPSDCACERNFRVDPCTCSCLNMHEHV